MEVRVARLEEDVREIKTILRGSDARLTAIDIGIAELRWRMQHLPMPRLMLTAVVGGQMTLAGLLYAALRLATH